MNRNRWLYLAVAVVCVVGLLASSCAKAPEKLVIPPVEEGWEPPVAGMKKGEEDMYLELLWALPSARSAPPAGFEFTGPEWFFNEIKERTKGRLIVNINYAEIGTMLEIERLISAGVVDGGFTSPTYFPIERPLCNILWMPNFTLEDWGLAMKLWDYCLRHPLVLENYAKDNMTFGYMLDGMWDYNLYIRKGVPKITKVEDFKGLCARSYGYWSVMWQELGMAPVFITAFETYEGMQKGMIDVAHLGLGSLKSWGLWEVSDRVIDMALTAVGSMYALNMDVWNSLPQYMKDIWYEAHAPAQEYHLSMGLAELEVVMQFAQEKGVEIYKLSPEEQAKFDAAGTPAYEQWVAALLKQERGKKIKEYLKDVIAYRDSLTGYHWDICDGLY